MPSTDHPPEVLVFLGPTMSVDEAQSILPNAGYLPPVRCGDVLAATRLRPSTLVILDGYFERTAAVWHKEILLALELGIRVVGAASMGALRAAELHTFGVEGVGEIFEAYRDRAIVDDDEVALVHGPDFATWNQPMVNIRATLGRALVEGVVDAESADMVRRAAKATFYAERSLECAVEACVRAGAPAVALERLVEWSRRGGYVDRKKLDAAEALRRVATTSPPPGARRVEVARFSSFRALRAHVAARPFPVYRSWLPLEERVACAARLLGPEYVHARSLAAWLGAAYAIAEGRLGDGGSAPGLHERARPTVAGRRERVESMLEGVAAHPAVARALSLLEPELAAGSRSRAVEVARDTIARIATVVLLSTREDGRRLSPERVQRAADAYRRERLLFAPEHLDAHLQRHDADLELFALAMELQVVRDLVVDGFRVDLLGGDPDAGGEVFWLYDALVWTGLDGAAAELLADASRRRLCYREIGGSPDTAARALDFPGGPRELRSFAGVA